VVGSLGTAFKISSLTTIGNVAHYILPTDGLWRGAIYYLEPQSFVAQRLTNSPDSGNPFFAQDTNMDLPRLGRCLVPRRARCRIVSFERREL